MAQRSDAWVENRPSRALGWPDLREVWAYRELVWSIAQRNLKVRYKQAVIGVGWAVAQPLIGAAVMTVVFHRLIKVSGDGMPYAVFAFVGYSVWSFLAVSLSAATASLVEEAELVTKMYFPRLCVPVAAVVPGVVNLLLSFVGLAVLFVVSDHYPNAAILTLPLWLALALVLVVGLGAGLSALNATYRDVGNALGFVLQLWLFISPVAYSASRVPAGWRHVYGLNPVVGILEGFRWALAAGPAPTGDALAGLALAALLVAGALMYFHRVERRVADVI